mgnify:FL=1
MFEKEKALFKKYQGALQHSYPLGGFVVIKGDEVLGVWYDRLDALNEGYKAYGDVPMLVKDINGEETVWDAGIFGSAAVAILNEAMKNGSIGK